MEFYRYIVREYGSVNDFGGFSSLRIPNAKLNLETYGMLRETPKGYWIGYLDFGDLGKRWVSKTSKKRFAYPTKEEALKNFIYRTERRVAILDRQINISKIGLDLAEREKQKK